MLVAVAEHRAPNRRFVPARAGRSGGGSSRWRRNGVHPRACGGERRCHARIDDDPGASPRLRDDCLGDVDLALRGGRVCIARTALSTLGGCGHPQHLPAIRPRSILASSPVAAFCASFSWRKCGVLGNRPVGARVTFGLSCSSSCRARVSAAIHARTSWRLCACVAVARFTVVSLGFAVSSLLRSRPAGPPLPPTSIVGTRRHGLCRSLLRPG